MSLMPLPGKGVRLREGDFVLVRDGVKLVRGWIVDKAVSVSSNDLWVFSKATSADWVNGISDLQGYATDLRGLKGRESQVVHRDNIIFVSRSHLCPVGSEVSLLGKGRGRVLEVWDDGHNMFTDVLLILCGEERVSAYVGEVRLVSSPPKPQLTPLNEFVISVDEVPIEAEGRGFSLPIISDEEIVV